jgi:hypothetical protein
MLCWSERERRRTEGKGKAKLFLGNTLHTGCGGRRSLSVFFNISFLPSLEEGEEETSPQHNCRDRKLIEGQS